MTSSATAPVDRYRRRRESGEASRIETRRRLLAAADTLFRENGYAGATIAAIAAAASVSVQTVYLAWGSKRELFQAAGKATATASGEPADGQEWNEQIRAELDADCADKSAAAYLAAVSKLFTKVAVRTARYRQLRIEAAASDPGIAADWDARQGERRETLAVVAKLIPPQDLRPGMTHAYILDTLWALASPEMFDLLTTTGGHTPETFQLWLSRTLQAALCR